MLLQFRLFYKQILLLTKLLNYPSQRQYPLSSLKFVEQVKQFDFNIPLQVRQLGSQMIY